MKPITKNSAYAYLNKIKTESNGSINISPYMKKVAANEQVPTDVLLFINEHIGLPQLYTYNVIYDRRRTSPLYKNLVNENLDDENKAIALTSLLTQTFIHTRDLVKEGKSEDVSEYADLMNVKEITEALNQYTNGDATKLNELFQDIRLTFKQLFG